MTKTQKYLSISQDSMGNPYKIPYLEIVGKKPGQGITLCAGIHGDEVNSQKIIFDVFHAINPKTLKGTLRCFPICNIPGYMSKSRNFSDTIDLNHIMNGNGAVKFPSTQYVKELLPHILQTDIVIDLHSDRAGLTNCCFAYADMNKPAIAKIAKKLTVDAIINHVPSDRTLRGTCAKKNILCITIETGDALSYDSVLTKQVTKGLMNILTNKTSLKKTRVYARSDWQIATHGGYTPLCVKPKQKVKAGQMIGVCYDALGNILTTYLSESDGMVLVTAKNPVLQKGDKLIHIAK